MLLTIFNVVYVLIAFAMIVLILLQRGAGAQAGSGFGSGASSTVFGARGAATFLTRSTAILAGLFFLLSLGMSMYLGGSTATKPTEDVGVMSGVETPVANPQTPVAVPNSSDVPQASPPPTNTEQLVPPVATSDVPGDTSYEEPAVKEDNAKGKSDQTKSSKKNTEKTEK